MKERPIPRRIYVASLSDYNAGNLHGRWIDATQGADHINAEIQDMLSQSEHEPAEEWAIHDYEGFGAASLSEWSCIDDVAKLAEGLEEHGGVFGGLVEHFGGLPGGLDEATTAINEHYCGEFDSFGEFAQQHVEECYSEILEQLPGFIRYHIDYEGIASDLEMGGDVFTVEIQGRVHVFWS